MMWKVTVDFIEDGEDNYEEVEVEARTEEVAREKAVDQVEAMHDVEEIVQVDIRNA